MTTRLVLIVLSVLTVTACGTSGSDPADLQAGAVRPAAVGPLASIRVLPAQQTIMTGQTLNFRATGFDANGNALTGLVFSWESGDTGVAVIDQSGAVTAVGMGRTTITARANGISGNATLTVTAVATIQIIPLLARTIPGSAVLFTAVARDQSGVQVQGSKFQWESSEPAVVTMNATTGLARGISLGEVEITATSDGVTSAPSSLTVTLAASIEVLPKFMNIARGGSQQFSALVRDVSGNPVSAADVEWISSDPSIVMIDDKGLAVALADGDVEITADVDTGAKIASFAPTPAGVTVTPAVISSIQVTPLSGITVPGSTVQFTATARNAAGAAIQGVSFVWESSDRAVADITSSGVAIGIGVGDAVITATAGGVKSPPAPLVVTTIASIEVNPSSTSISVGNTMQFFAIVKDEEGRLIRQANAEWTSSDPGVATIDENGRATAVAPGVTRISASAGGIVSDPANPALLTVTSVATVDITAPAATVDVGKTVQFTAVARDAAGTAVVGVPFQWTSSNEGVATIDPVSGVATGVSTGTAIVTATAEGVTSNQLTLEVTATGVPNAITMTATSPISVFGTSTVQATVRDNAGTLVPPTVVEFNVSNESFGTVSPQATTLNGVASATFKAGNQAGTAAVIATAGAANASIEIVINAASPVSIEFFSAQPPAIGLKGAGQTETSVMTFLVKDTNGNPVADGTTVCFSLKGPGGGAAISTTQESTSGFGTPTAGQVATILQSGTLPGPARIVATVAQGKDCSSLTTIVTESAPVSIGGGVPDLAHFSMSAVRQNLASFLGDPRGSSIDNVQTTLNVLLADQFGNFNVLEGTSVSFIIEAGSIDRSNTLSAQGVTSVTVRTQAPAPIDRDPDTDTVFSQPVDGVFTPCSVSGEIPGPGCNREDGDVTVVALVKGQECFTDRNGNGVFDGGTEFDAVTQVLCDVGEPFINANDNVFAVGDTFTSGGTTITVGAGGPNVGKPKFDANEIFVDVNGNGVWDGPNGVWDGPGGPGAQEATIWKEIKLVFSGRPDQKEVKAITTVAPAFANVEDPQGWCLDVGEFMTFRLTIADNNGDFAGNPAPNSPTGNRPMGDSIVTFSTTAGNITPTAVDISDGSGPFVVEFSIANDFEVEAGTGIPPAPEAASISIEGIWAVPGFADTPITFPIIGGTLVKVSPGDPGSCGALGLPSPLPN